MPFKWQINASAVGKLLGFFGKDRQHQAIAETWQMNLKRMPRFGVRPSVQPTRPTIEQVVQKEIATSKEYTVLVQAGVKRTVKQEQVVHTMQTIAKRKATASAAIAVEADRAVKRSRQCLLHTYRNIKAGHRKTRIGGFFAVETKIYEKKSTKTSRLTTLDHAAGNGWKPKALAVEQTQVLVRQADIATKKAVVAEAVCKHIVKTASKQINQQRGIQKEASDLELVQQQYPGVKSGNQAKFLQVGRGTGRYAAFVIGKIDGFDATTDTIYELKHRQSRLFHELRHYEQVQCLLYLKMFKKTRVTLVESYCGQQVYYPMELQGDALFHNGEETLRWSNILTGLDNITHLLNKAEVDESYRNILMQKIF
jgi:hypothetical protein